MTKQTLSLNTTTSQSEKIAAADEAAWVGKRTMFQPVTADSIRTGILSAMDTLAHTFCELEPRIVGTNGRQYKVDATLPAGVEADADIDVNIHRYMQSQLLSVVCWKTEDMLHRCLDRIADQEKQIKAARQQVERGRAEEGFVEAKRAFLYTLEDQAAMLRVAFEAAQVGYLDQTGEEYETKEMRRQRELTVAASKPSDAAERLAAEAAARRAARGF